MAADNLRRAVLSRWTGAVTSFAWDTLCGALLTATAPAPGSPAGRTVATGCIQLVQADVVESPAVISIPDDVDRELLRLGMPGNATVFNDNAGVIGIIASILVWISSYTAYL